MLSQCAADASVVRYTKHSCAIAGMVGHREIHAASDVVNDSTRCKIDKWFSKLGISRKKVRFYRKIDCIYTIFSSFIFHAIKQKFHTFSMNSLVLRYLLQVCRAASRVNSSNVVVNQSPW